MSEMVVGFIPLVDCAALVVAREMGFAAAEGIRLTLARESSWANIRDRVVVGHFDAAHMLGPMAVASALGLGHLKVPMVAPFALGLGGNAVTISNELHRSLQDHGHPAGAQLGARSTAVSAGAALKKVIVDRVSAGLAPLTFGMVYPFSCHNYELRYWLAACGIDPDHDVRLVVIPPPFLVDAMRAGHIDGFCVGEPWNGVAAEAGAGRILMATTAIWRWSPEKVLGCRADWAERRSDELSALCRALYRASQWCAAPANREELASILAQPGYVAEPAPRIEAALAGRLPVGASGDETLVEDFHVAVDRAATFPWKSHALWFYSQMVRWGQARWSAKQAEEASAVYRPDLYRRALESLDVDFPLVDGKTEGGDAETVVVPSRNGTLSFYDSGFLDRRPFDPSLVEAYARAFDPSAPR